MGFLQKLLHFLSQPSSGATNTGDPYGLWFHFQCNRCGSFVRIRVDRRNDLNREDGPGTFVLHKDVMDDKCFQMMNAELWLDESYQVVEANVTGGKLVSAEEYDAAQAG